MERKLSDIDVLWIRAACILNHKRFGSVKIAEMFCVSRRVIEAVVKRETYRHLRARTVPPDVLTESVPLMVGVIIMDRDHPKGGWPREAMPDETPEWSMTAKDFDQQHGVDEDYRRNYWTTAPLVSPSEPVSKADYDLVSWICRQGVTEYAESRRSNLGLETVKKRKPRRTKRQMEWERNVTKPAQAALKLERETLKLAKRQARLEAEYATYMTKAKLPPPITPEALAVLRAKLKKVP
ncbi:hypothetical protein PQR53_07825 [Paraburkholderia fungorum]|uniref:hypothetical protein n=1 Tax=Paraburkholderia fungorum TaxID=134537 RepID=UPI0038BBE23A